MPVRGLRGTPTFPCQVAGSEKRSVGPGTGDGLQLAAGRRRSPLRASRGRAGAAGRPCRPGRSSRPSSSAGAVEPRSRSSLFSCAWFGGVQCFRQLRPSGESTSTLSPQFVLAVERAVAGRDEQVAGRRIDDRSRTPPDRRVAAGAGRRLHDRAAVRAERVPDADDVAVRGIEGHDVALVRRRVADVAVGRGDHEPVREVERRGELLVRRVAGDRGRPEHLAVRDRELPDARRRARRRRSLRGRVGDRASWS